VTAVTTQPMQPIYENSWRLHVAMGTILEEDLYGEFRVIGIEIAQQVTRVEYKYRLLIFPIRGNYPVLSINLEKNAFAEKFGGGAYFLGVHDASAHYNMGIALEGKGDIDYDEFRDAAWPLATTRLNLED
jgi:hypothetical protein